MKRIKSFCKEHKQAALLILFALIVFLGASAVSDIHVADMRANPDSGGMEETSQAESGSEEEGETIEETAPFSDAQQAIYDRYDADTKELLAFLSRNLWTARNGTKSLRFTDTVLTETASDETVSASFAISALETAKETQTGANGESTTVTTYTAALLCENGTSLMTVQVFLDNLTGEETASVTSSLFSLSESYVIDEAAGALSITGLTSAFSEQIDNRSDEMVKAVQDFCAQRYPSATSASWSKLVSIDYGSQTVETSFVLDLATNTVVWVTYDLSTQTFTLD